LLVYELFNFINKYFYEACLFDICFLAQYVYGMTRFPELISQFIILCLWKIRSWLMIACIMAFVVGMGVACIWILCWKWHNSW